MSFQPDIFVSWTSLLDAFEFCLIRTNFTKPEVFVWTNRITLKDLNKPQETVARGLVNFN